MSPRNRWLCCVGVLVFAADPASKTGVEMCERLEEVATTSALTLLTTDKNLEPETAERKRLTRCSSADFAQKPSDHKRKAEDKWCPSDGNEKGQVLEGTNNEWPMTLQYCTSRAFGITELVRDSDHLSQ